MTRSEHSLIAGAEKLLSRHHHLLVSTIGIRRLSLVNQIKEVRLVGRLLSVTNSTRRADPIVTNTSAVTLVLVLVLSEGTRVAL